MVQSKKIRICGDLKAFVHDELVASDEWAELREEAAPELAERTKDLSLKLPEEIAA